MGRKRSLLEGMGLTMGSNFTDMSYGPNSFSTIMIRVRDRKVNVIENLSISTLQELMGRNNPY